MQIKHNYVSTIPEEPTSGVPNGRVGPNEWNDAHAIVWDGTSSQFVKGDGSLDSSTYLTASTAVSSFSAGTTGLLPNTPTTGAVTLSGTLSSANGGLGNGTWTTNSIPYFNGTNFTEDNPFLAWVDGTHILNLGAGISFAANNVTITQGANSSGVGFSYTQTGSSGANATTGTTTSAGGLVTTFGGTGGNTSSATANSRAGAGGVVNLTGGTGGNNTGTNRGFGGVGGDVTLLGGTGGNYTGSGSTSTLAGGGGKVTITGGSGGTTTTTNGTQGSGGLITIKGGNGSSASVTTQAAGAGGDVSLNAGTGGISATGQIGGNFTGGSGGGGDASLTNSTSINKGGNGGFVLFSAASGGSASNSTVGNTAGAGGALTLSAGGGGQATGTTPLGAAGGNVTIKAGDATNSTGTSANGGIVYFQPGASGPSGGTTGYIVLNGNGTTNVGGTSIGANSAPGAQLQINPLAATTIGEIVKGFASQSADLTQWQNSSGTPLAKVDASGNITGATIIKSGGTSSQFLKADGSVDSNTYVTSSTGAFVNNATDSTLTRSGAGPYTLGINLANSNTWSANQTINGLIVTNGLGGTRALSSAAPNSTSFTEWVLTDELGGLSGFYKNGSARSADGGGDAFNFYTDAGLFQIRAGGGMVFLTGGYPGTNYGQVTTGGLWSLGSSNTPTARADIAASTTSNASLRIRSGTAPTSPNDGDIWYDSTQKSIRSALNGAIASDTRTLFTGSSSKTITNTTAETSAIPTGVGSLTLPANYWIVGKTIELNGGGVFSSALTPGNVTINVKYGSTVIATGTITNLLGSASNLPFTFQARVTCYSTGTSGTVVVDGQLQYQNATGLQPRTSLALNNSGNTTTINTTTSNLLDITVTFATQSASNIIKTTTAIAKENN